MPSFTFVSTANAFVLRGATPVFVDIRPDTLNIDETLIEAAITPRTRAIVVVHYAGVGCDMDAIVAMARRHGLVVIEDAAQGLLASYQGRPLGSLGRPRRLQLPRDQERSVRRGRRAGDERRALGGAGRDPVGEGHRSLEVHPRAGGQVHLGGPRLVVPARRDHGGVPVGTARGGRDITAARLALWRSYAQACRRAATAPGIELPAIPPDCVHNAHLFRVLLPRHVPRGRRHRRSQPPRRERGLPLRPAAFGAGRPALRPRRRADDRHRRLQRAPRAAAAVDRAWATTHRRRLSASSPPRSRRASSGLSSRGSGVRFAMALALALAQLNPTVGDVAGNPARVREARDRAAREGADLVVFPELFLVGYPPEDLVLRPALVSAAAAALRELRARERRRRARPRRHAAVARSDGRLHNAVALVADGTSRAALQARAAQLRRLRREARVRAGAAARAGRLPRRAPRPADLRGHLVRRRSRASRARRAPSCCSCRTARRSRWRSRSSGSQLVARARARDRAARSSTSTRSAARTSSCSTAARSW